MASGRKWTREETLMALALYLLLPPNNRVVTNPDIVELAKRTSRTPSSIKLKIFNLASCDPSYPGLAMQNRSGLDERIWKEYETRGDDLTREAIRLLLEEGEFVVTRQIDPVRVDERDEEVAAYATKNHFRSLLLRNYDGRCCITGLKENELLDGYPIMPWNVIQDARDRLNPENGLLLNTLHGCAFERGLITLDSKLRVVVSKKVRHDKSSDKLIWSYEGSQIMVPGPCVPRQEFIEYHNDLVFVH